MRAQPLCVFMLFALLHSVLISQTSYRSFFVREYNCILWISDVDADSFNSQQTLRPDQEEEAGRIVSLLLKFTKVLKEK